MNFFSPQFWLLVSVAVAIYYFLPRQLQNWLLLTLNFIFLVSISWKSLLVYLLSAGFGYLCYIRLVNPNYNFKKIIFRCFLIFQIGLLVFFKLVAFRKGEIPLGLSYYSLAIAAFVLEVHWRRTEVRLSLCEFLVSAGFFPILGMGPIERFSKFSTQLKVKRNFVWDSLRSGCYHVVIGVFKITCIANVLDEAINQQEVALKIYGFGLIIYCFLSFMQLYAQFSGYIDIATGISLFFGLKIGRNFDQPYFANGINDVWKRWHISLTTWLRDFVFLPIVLKTKNVNLSMFVVFVLVALWHGINIIYLYWAIYWCGIFGIYLGFKKLKRKALQFPGHEFFEITLTLLVVSFSTLCFIIPITGFVDIASRIFPYTTASIWSFVDYSHLSLLRILFIMLSIVFMMAIETSSKKNFYFLLNLKTLSLIFLIGVFGKFVSQVFWYLRF